MELQLRKEILRGGRKRFGGVLSILTKLDLTLLTLRLPEGGRKDFSREPQRARNGRKIKACVGAGKATLTASMRSEDTK